MTSEVEGRDLEPRGVADIYPGWKGITQPCDACGHPVAVNAVSPSECFCSAECGYRLAGLDDATTTPGAPHDR